MADFEDANSPTWENCIEGQRQPHRRARAHDRARHGREAVHAERRGRRRCSCGRAAGTSRSGTSRSTARRCRARCSTSASTSSATTARNGRYFYLPKLESHLEARLWNDVFVWTQERLGVPQRDDQGDRPDRDDPRRVRDGRDPLRAARPLGRPQRRPLGLHLQRDQEARPPARVRAPRPRGRDDGRAVHALLLRAARQDVPPPRRARDGRHGGVHPLAPRPRGERGRAREGARGQGARGVARASTARGSRTPTSSRSRWSRSTACSATGRTRSTGSATTSRSAAADLLDVAATPGEITEAGPAQQRLGRDPVPRRLAAGLGRGRDQQPDGGRGDGRDLALAGLAVAPPRPRHRATTSRRITEEEIAKLGDGYDDARALFEQVATQRRATSSSSRCPRTTGCSRSSRPDRPQGRSDAQGSSAETSTAA